MPEIDGSTTDGHRGWIDGLRSAFRGQPERGVPPVSLLAYVIACWVGVFVGALCFFGKELIAPLGTATLPKEPALLQNLPEIVGGFLYIAGAVALIGVLPLAVLAAPILLPFLVWLSRRRLPSLWAAGGLGALAGALVVAILLLFFAAVDAEPMLARMTPMGSILALPAGAAAGLTYRALVAYRLRTALTAPALRP